MFKVFVVYGCAPKQFDPEPTYFTDYEVHPCCEYANYVSQCEPEEAHYWTLYGHLNIGGLEAIGDFETEAQANAVARMIRHQKYQAQKTIIDTIDQEELLMSASEDVISFANKIYDLLEY